MSHRRSVLRMKLNSVVDCFDSVVDSFDFDSVADSFDFAVDSFDFVVDSFDSVVEHQWRRGAVETVGRVVAARTIS
jgi:hypothetical protein